MTDASAVIEKLARSVLDELAARGATLAVAESLTGGLVVAALVAVPGASAVLRGGVVAYATELKHELLGVDAELLGRVGPVDLDVAVQMAAGARHRLGATYGVATTGVAGPDSPDGVPVGTVVTAVAGPTGSHAEAVTDVPGPRAAVRAWTVEHALRMLADALAPADDPPQPSAHA